MPLDLRPQARTASEASRIHSRLTDRACEFQWRAARWGAGVLVVAHLVGLNAWAWQERQALTAKQASVRNTLTQTFPKVQVVVDAPVQMERELAQLRQAAGSVSARDLEPLLAAAGAALPDGRLPNSIEYTPGELRLRGVTLAPDEESVVSGRLQAAGYRARVDDGSLLLRTEDRWKALAPREQNLVLAAGTVVALALLWWVAVAPALGTLRAAPARHAALDAQLQRMQGLQAEAQQLQATPATSPGDAVGALRFAAAALPFLLFVKFPNLPWRYVVAYGLAQGLGQFGFLFLGLQPGMTVGMASVVMQTK
eukprot:gene43684-58187_t